MQTNLKQTHSLSIDYIPTWFAKYERSFKSLIFVASFKNGINFLIDDHLIYIGRDQTPFALTLSSKVAVDWSLIDENCIAFIKGKKIHIANQSMNIVCDYSKSKLIDYRRVHTPIRETDLIKIRDSIADIETLNGFGMRPRDYVDSIQLRSFELRHLIGKGLGLTPSGDDFIVGVLFAQTLIKSKQSRLCDSVNIEAGATTLISREYLKYACKSDFSKRLLDLSMMDDNEDVGVYINRIEDVGYTSGLDTLSGILYVLDKEVGYEKNSSSIRW